MWWSPPPARVEPVVPAPLVPTVAEGATGIQGADGVEDLRGWAELPGAATRVASPSRRSTQNRVVPERFGFCGLADAASRGSESLVHVDPASWKKMLCLAESAKWLAAAEVEYSNLIVMQTWTLVLHPIKHNIICCCWLSKTKRKADGTIDQLKACLVAKSFMQVKGVDFSDVFAPTTCLESVRLLLSVMAIKGWGGKQMDIKGVFLNLGLKETLFMEQPEGFIDPSRSDYVCQLNGSIYGLKQSPQQWNVQLYTALLSFGLTVLSHVPSMYFRLKDGELDGMLVVHVDDLGFMGTSDFMVMVEEKLKLTFEISSNSDLDFFLSLKVDCNVSTQTVMVSQAAYIDQLCSAFLGDDVQGVKMPCDADFKLLAAAGPDGKRTGHPYASLIGGLLWVALCTRPDIAFAVTRLSQFLRKPTDEHWSAATCILWFLSATKGKQLVLGGDNTFCRFSDADWAEYLMDRKSTTGFGFRLGHGLISWRSKKQNLVALSSTKAEYVAMLETCCESLWLVQMMLELCVCKAGAITVYVDN